MKFSIITVCFNSEGMIGQAIESVLGQTCKDWEHLIIDGGSTDGTVDIVRKYEARYGGRLRFVSEPDNGIYDAMNKGLRMASGELVGILNSDDWYELDALEAIDKASSASPGRDVYYGIVRMIGLDGKEERLLRWSHTNLAKGNICHQCCFISSEAYRKYGHFDLSYKIAADYDFALRASFGGGSFLPVDHIIANFRTCGISSTACFRGELEKLRIQRKHGMFSPMKARLLLLKVFGISAVRWIEG